MLHAGYRVLAAFGWIAGGSAASGGGLGQTQKGKCAWSRLAKESKTVTRQTRQAPFAPLCMACRNTFRTPAIFDLKSRVCAPSLWMQACGTVHPALGSSSEGMVLSVPPTLRYGLVGIVWALR